MSDQYQGENMSGPVEPSHAAIYNQVSLLANNFKHLEKAIDKYKSEDTEFKKELKIDNAERDKRISRAEIRSALIFGGIAAVSVLLQYVIGPPRERVETRYISMPAPAQQAQQQPPRP